MTCVGTWAVDLPAPSTPSKRKRGSEGALPAQVSPQRRAGAPAFLKPNLQWSNFGVTYLFCDAKSSAASDKYVRLYDGWTMAQAHSEAITHFHLKESDRVGDYNNELAVCWARSRLLLSLRVLGAGDQGSSVPVGTRPIGGGNEVVVKTDELVKLHTCRQRILDMEQLVKDTGMIARQGQARTLASLCEGH